MNKETPTIDIARISIILVRDYAPDRLTLSKSMPLPFSPFIEQDAYSYKTIDLTKSEPLTYIKHRYKDLWLYIENGKPIFKPLQRDWSGFTTYKPPTYFWIDYLEFPSFILYQQPIYGDKNIKYLIYSEAYYTDLKTGKPDVFNPAIYMGWAKNPLVASRFSFTSIEWADLLTMNIPAKTFFTGAKQIPETYIISETASKQKPLPPLYSPQQDKNKKIIVKK
jgi:hypothetical protein